MNSKEEFIKIYNENIHRDGADKLLDFLVGAHSDFFEAPASTKYHGSHEGGLCEHSVNVYHCLKDYLSRQRVKDTYKMKYSDETIAIVALLHDICKTNIYKKGFKNQKINDKWEKVPTYEFNDEMPYGHGEKSVYMIQPFMKLSHEEAFAIRYHMGFSSVELANNVGKVFEMFPLAFALSTADMEATYYCEGKPQNKM
mgnify:FL=1